MAMAVKPGVTGLHTPRLEARKKALRAIFAPVQMGTAWQKYVRPGLRSQEVIDLFDYNDFHWNRQARFVDLEAAIINGRYRPGQSIPTKLEKNQGVCRTVVTPSPEDSLVLQCIVESLLPKAIKKQPSQNAFFSRSHKSFAGSFTFGKDYIWFKQWAIFSKKRFQIASAHPWITTTDISTYFDNISYTHLRNIISTLGEIEEVVLDILFSVLEGVSWRPDYLPSSGVGLPQVQFDAPRLLAHVYLFELDTYLKEKTSNCFVRWVDDITFAVDSKQTGKATLRDIDILLQMRGVRLNSSKTKVLSAPQARRYFYQRENEYIDRLRREIEVEQKKGSSTKALESKAFHSFELFLKREKFGHHDKIVKRFLGLFIVTKNPSAVTYCLSSFSEEPGLRDTAYRYFAALGPSKRLLTGLESYLFDGSALDDASLCQIARVITDWEVVPSTAVHAATKKLAERCAGKSWISDDPYRFVLALWLLCKYGSQTRLRSFLEEFEELWIHSSFLSRQVMTSGCKLRSKANYLWLTKKIRRHSFSPALSVGGAIDVLKSFTKTVPSDIRLYLTNGGNKTTYSLQRFLIAVAVLSSDKLEPATKSSLKAAIKPVLTDPLYLRVLDKI